MLDCRHYIGVDHTHFSPAVLNMPVAGKKASVAIYAHLAQKYGGILSEAAANEGLSLYAEVVEDARSHPGSHPNVDILFNVLAQPDVKVIIQVNKQ